MARWRRLRLPGIALLVLAAGTALGCWLPKGPPVYVDGRHGKLWSGKGVLLETNEDGSWCKVAVRNRALVVEKRWVDCRAVHRRMPGE
ncbi:MAG: hypothetical protein R3263_10595 [Myxococcota bacterium]|nr:hypothetical protein [Myxococcota bacterium]